LRWIRRQNSYSEFWALRNISFLVNQGEAVGVVGANGAGKSTLLKVIARVLHPTQGHVKVCGVVTPILALRAGFDPEMTGRENIYLIGAMFGFSRKVMNKKLDGLVSFSGLSDFIDAPLRTYSNGMVARLAFAVATDVNPDLLLLDEILTVGDKDFQRKCLDRMSGFLSRGTTIFLVSHNLNAIERICTRVIWLEHGSIRADGPTNLVLDRYRHEKAQPLIDNSQVIEA